MTLEWLIGWWNLIFLVPFAIALSYLGLYISTGITFGDADADGDLDADADVDADADGHADAHDALGDADADADADGDHDGDTNDQNAHAEHLGSAHQSEHGKDKSHGHGVWLLSVIGVGKVPVSLVLMMLFMTWGASGFAATQVMHKSIAAGEKIAMLAMPVAAIVCLASTAILAQIFGKLVPMHEAPAASLAGLVGEPGIAVLPITETFGLARVRKIDGGGADIQVPCRVAPGQPSIGAHAPIVVLRFDRAERFFYVTTPESVEGA